MTPPTWTELFRVFGQIGLLSFGGPAAQIALMHRELVETRTLMDEDAFLRALSLCMLLPGPEAMQLATYAGWRLRGTPGGILAGLLFVLPGAIVIAILVALYVRFGQLEPVQAAFLGVKAAVIVIVLQALLKVARKALTRRSAWAVAGLAFIAIFALGLPFPLIIAAAALWGFFNAPPGTSASPTPSRKANTLATVALWGGLWLAPLAALTLTGADFLADVGWFFARLAVVTFGGAYAVLGYMTQTVVQDMGWITTGQMIDALGLAETTPGPLILVTQFVAMLAGAEAGAWTALAAGAVALWATFMPCFLWIFVAAPYLEALSSRPRLAGALSAITAAVVGVILNLTLWFALHVVFREVNTPGGGLLALPVPDPQSLDPVALGLTAMAAILMLGLRVGLAPSLALMAAAGLVAGLLGT